MMRLFSLHRERRYVVIVNGRAMHHPLDELTIRALWPDAHPEHGHHRSAHGDTYEFRRVR